MVMMRSLMAILAVALALTMGGVTRAAEPGTPVD
jgi:hypothetical protein